MYARVWLKEHGTVVQRRLTFTVQGPGYSAALTVSYRDGIEKENKNLRKSISLRNYSWLIFFPVPFPSAFTLAGGGLLV